MPRTVRMEKMPKTIQMEKYLLAVGAMGLAGLIVSVYLLSDYSEPLMNIMRITVEYFQY